MENPPILTPVYISDRCAASLDTHTLTVRCGCGVVRLPQVNKAINIFKCTTKDNAFANFPSDAIFNTAMIKLNITNVILHSCNIPV